MSEFATHHPLVTAAYFASVLLITMFVPHPLVSVWAMIGALGFFLKAERPVNRYKGLGFYLFFFAAAALSNPLFSHNGATVLLFMNGNPITAESLLYGVHLGVMLLAVIYWFRSFTLVMSDDKLLYLCGKLSAKMALLLSAALRFLPLFQRQAEKIRLTQKTMGLFASDTWLDQLRGTIRVYSVLITWALERAIDSGASMKARGYGLRGRTHYALYTFRRRDAVLLGTVVLLDGWILAAAGMGELAFAFYPTLSPIMADGFGLSALIAFAILSLLPLIIEVKGDLQWHCYRSNI